MGTMEATPGGTDREPDTETETENTFDSTFNTARDQVRSSTSLRLEKIVDEDLDGRHDEKVFCTEESQVSSGASTYCCTGPGMPELPL